MYRTKKVDFGYKKISEEEKNSQVKRVFDSVSKKYDLMNDILSFGLHRWWKRTIVERAHIQPGMQVLDIASGTGDLALSFYSRVGKNGKVIATDINKSMLCIAQERFEKEDVDIQIIQSDAEALPFESNSFDVVSVSFGLRNMTHKEKALKEMLRVLKPHGKLFVLEFSKVNSFFKPFYDLYSFRIMPLLGKMIAGDADSYTYLPESIRKHPDQKTLAVMMRNVGFRDVSWINKTFGICALHEGEK